MEKSFNERYPNHRQEARNKRIAQMIPAVGWWKVRVQDLKEVQDDQILIEPVIFFAIYEFEERSIWDGGSSPWEVDQLIYAHTGAGDDYFMIYDQVNNSDDSRLFYDPDFRRSREEQWVGESFINEQIEYYKERRERKEKEKTKKAKE